MLKFARWIDKLVFQFKVGWARGIMNSATKLVDSGYSIGTIAKLAGISESCAKIIIDIEMGV